MEYAAHEPYLTMPLDSQERKDTPIISGVLDYFPAAIAAVAKLSKQGNDKHNPGEPLHWARGKSNDHADCIGRHLADRGVINPETGFSHSVEIAWRALAMLQLELEAAGAPLPRGAWAPVVVTGGSSSGIGLSTRAGITTENVLSQPLSYAEKYDLIFERRVKNAVLQGLSEKEARIQICGTVPCTTCGKYGD